MIRNHQIAENVSPHFHIATSCRKQIAHGGELRRNSSQMAKSRNNQTVKLAAANRRQYKTQRAKIAVASRPDVRRDKVGSNRNAKGSRNKLKMGIENAAHALPDPDLIPAVVRRQQVSCIIT